MDVQEILANKLIEHGLLRHTQTPLGGKEGNILTVEGSHPPHLEERVVREANMAGEVRRWGQSRRDLAAICLKGKSTDALKVRVRLVDCAGILITGLGADEAGEAVGLAC
jgi:hypothetical protein